MMNNIVTQLFEDKKCMTYDIIGRKKQGLFLIFENRMKKTKTKISCFRQMEQIGLYNIGSHLHKCRKKTPQHENGLSSSPKGFVFNFFLFPCFEIRCSYIYANTRNYDAKKLL